MVILVIEDCPRKNVSRINFDREPENIVECPTKTETVDNSADI